MNNMEARWKKHPTVDVIIPVYKPDKTFSRLLQMLTKQTYPIGQIIVMNTERAYWNDKGYGGIPELKVYHVAKQDYDHGETRNIGASHSTADLMIFMTDDAVPADNRLVEYLVKAFEGRGAEGQTVAVAYGRQIPTKDCRLIEQMSRAFNYPGESLLKTRKDLKQLGIKTYFASNVCCAYRRDIFLKQGGFVHPTIFNEDMIYAAGVIQAGYGVMYVADARVIHSHNLSGRQQLRRNFDLAVSQADHPEVFDGIPSEGEGIRMVKQIAMGIIRTGRPWLLVPLVFGSGCKYLGYFLGKRYKKLPAWMVRQLTSNLEYWNKKERNLS